jgi:hypothetical protein
MARLQDLCEILRSKNASPYEVSFDLVFKDDATYEQVRTSGVLTPDLFASLYKLSLPDVRVFRWFPQGRALKVTVPRHHVSGSPGENDLYGAQQHAPLLTVEVPAER